MNREPNDGELLDAVSACEIEILGMAEILLALRDSSIVPAASLDLLYADAIRIAERLHDTMDDYLLRCPDPCQKTSR